jgi:hypothetical protein
MKRRLRRTEEMADAAAPEDEEKDADEDEGEA